MPSKVVLYEFSRGERGIFVELYFPMKAAYQGAVFDALRHGHDNKKVIKELHRYAKVLIEEFKEQPNLFNPRHYEETKEERHALEPTLQEARQRISMYEPYFQGWSIYEVKGVWFANQHTAEELTQVVRIMFRLPSKHTKMSIKSGCFDVLRSILYWCIESHGNLDEHRLWDEEEQELFISSKKGWIDKKLTFARKHFASIAKEVAKWVDDCALFIFGYLVKQFAEKVLIEETKEQVIWVTSFFNLTINEIKRSPQL